MFALLAMRNEGSFEGNVPSFFFSRPARELIIRNARVTAR
jgi:hypothetical protein